MFALSSAVPGFVVANHPLLHPKDEMQKVVWFPSGAPPMVTISTPMSGHAVSSVTAEADPTRVIVSNRFRSRPEDVSILSSPKSIQVSVPLFGNSAQRGASATVLNNTSQQ